MVKKFKDKQGNPISRGPYFTKNRDLVYFREIKEGEWLVEGTQVSWPISPKESKLYTKASKEDAREELRICKNYVSWIEKMLNY